MWPEGRNNPYIKGLGNFEGEIKARSVLQDGGEVLSVASSSVTSFSAVNLTTLDTGDIYAFDIDDIESTPESDGVLVPGTMNFLG